MLQVAARYEKDYRATCLTVSQAVSCRKYVFLCVETVTLMAFTDKTP